ncbi:unnamed protein product [Pedinophyceae sp. YPF-701]|nr:unnamed protein product [Pedinophyceae sp. YPF-701]
MRASQLAHVPRVSCRSNGSSLRCRSRRRGETCRVGSSLNARGTRRYHRGTRCAARVHGAWPTPKEIADRRWWDEVDPKDEDEQTSMPASQALRCLWHIAKPDTPLLCVGGVFLVGAALAELAIPHFVSAALASVAGLPGPASPTGPAGFNVFASALHGVAVGDSARHAALRAALAGLAVCSAGYAVFASGRGMCFSMLGGRMSLRLRDGLYRAILSRRVSFFDNEEAGGLSSRLAADAQVVCKSLSTTLNIALRNAIQAVLGSAYLVVLSPPLFALTSAITGAMIWCTWVYGSYSRRAQKAQQDTLADSTQVAEETFRHARLVKATGNEAQEAERYHLRLQRMLAVTLRQTVAYGVYLVGQTTLIRMAKVAALMGGGALALAGHISYNDAATFAFYVDFTLWSFLAVADQTAYLMESLGASERVFSLLQGEERKGYVDDGSAVKGGTKQVPGWEGGARLEDVVFRYPSRPQNVALDHVSLDIPAGKMTALVGPSGSGKSTVVALMQALYGHAQGHVRLGPPGRGCGGDWIELSDADPTWYRSQVAAVVQDNPIVSGTIEHNITYGMSREARAQVTRADVVEAAELANAHEFIAKLSHGYDTEVSERLLSGGQKQRLALARALVRRPKLLILDEATSALDSESEALVLAALDRVMERGGRTLLVIAHRLGTVRKAHQIAVMEEGKVRELGSHAQLLKKRGTYYQLVVRQSQDALDALDLSTMTIDEEGLPDSPVRVASYARAAVEGGPLSPADGGPSGEGGSPMPDIPVDLPVSVSTQEARRSLSDSLDSVDDSSDEEENGAGCD